MWEVSWRRNRTATYWPPLYGHNSVSFPFSRVAQPGTQPLWDIFLIPASSLQLIWISTAQSGVLRVPSAGCWFSLPHLISNWLNFLCTELYNCSMPTFFLWASQIALNSTRPRSYPDIPRPDAPVIYTGAFPILTAWPGSIYYVTPSNYLLNQVLWKTACK